MSTWLRSRDVRQQREASASEIAELAASTARLFPGRGVPLRVRLALRVYGRTQKSSSAAAVLYGMILGIWWPIPIAMILDKGRGSIRNMLGWFYHGSINAASSIDDPSKMIESILRMCGSLALYLTIWYLLAFAPIVTPLRAIRGYPGIPIPGRRVALLNRQASIVHSCAVAIIACGKAVGKSGERRVTEAHAAADGVRLIRQKLPILAYSDASPKGIRRKRRKLALSHSRKVAKILKGYEDRMIEASDEELKAIADSLLKIADRAANRRHTELLDADQLPASIASERESFRLAVGALLTLLLSASSVAVLNFLGVADGLEPVAITASLIVSAVIVFRGKALQKLESLGLLGGGASRSGGASENDPGNPT
ncbi:hypothetical protein [Kitasatospora camelliae]|uniref:Uncharacterized protein n=1 Tax=Kitasatospora camelliae TaxID=3156397 RepID=A0AAU8K153_9ACTN